MTKTSLVVLFSVILGAPLVGGLASYAAPGAAGEGPGLDNSTRPPPWHVPVQRSPAPDAGAGGAGGVPDGGVATTNAGGPRLGASK